MKLLSEHMELTVRSDHPMAGRQSVKRSELDGLPFCLAGNPHGSRALVERYCSEGGIRLDVDIEIDSMSLMKAALRSLPVYGLVAPRDIDPGYGLVTIPIEAPLIRTMYLARLRDRAEKPLVNALIKEVKAAVGELFPTVRTVGNRVRSRTQKE